jgi:hypothetical protein
VFESSSFKSVGTRPAFSSIHFRGSDPFFDEDPQLFDDDEISGIAYISGTDG